MSIIPQISHRPGNSQEHINTFLRVIHYDSNRLNIKYSSIPCYKLHKTRVRQSQGKTSQSHSKDRNLPHEPPPAPLYPSPTPPFPAPRLPSIRLGSMLSSSDLLASCISLGPLDGSGRSRDTEKSENLRRSPRHSRRRRVLGVDSASRPE